MAERSGDTALGRAERGGLGDRTKCAVAATALPGLTNNFGMHGLGKGGA